MVGKRIALKRKMAGFATQSDLADALKIDRARVSEWERGIVMPKKNRAELLKTIMATESEIFDLNPPEEEAAEFSSLPPGAPTRAELTALGSAFALSSQGKRLLALYILTTDDSYRRRAAAIPDVAPIALVLKKSLLSS